MWWDTNVFVVRQVFFEVAICLITYTTGINLAFPSILNPALLAPDSDIKVTPDQASWIATCIGIGGLMGFAVLPSVFDFYGRKMANILTNLFMLIGSLILYVAKDVYALAFARLAQGLSIGGNFISAITLCECVSPKRRGYFLVLNKVSLGFGSLTCHALIFILNWKQIALVGALANLISIIIFAISSESPAFLAMCGQFDKCAEAFEWYRGVSINAKKELKELVTAQTERLRIKEREKDASVFKKIKDMMMTKGFQKSFYIATLLALCIDSCGRYFVLAYITQILIELTNNKTLSMYLSAVTDCMLIIALCISSVLVKIFDRRTLLFKLGFSSAFLMFMVSFSIILTSKVDFIQHLKWLTPGVILFHTFITNLALVPIAYALCGEVFPLEQRGIGTFFSGITFLIFFNVVIKLTPLMIDETGVEGTYSIYGFILFILLVLLRLVLPETKDKTLQQIEDEIKGIMRNNSDTELLKLSKVSNC